MRKSWHTRSYLVSLSLFSVCLRFFLLYSLKVPERRTGLFPLGPYISFAAAAWNLQPMVQTLSCCLPMHYHASDMSMRTSLARHLAAFRMAVGKLETYYRDLPTPPPTPLQGELLPYPSSFTSLLDRTLQNFDYVKRVMDDKLLFLGQMPDNRTICIKFVRRYSNEAHKCCAQLGFAPQLFGFESLPGGWFMVIMDWLGSDKWCPLNEITMTQNDVAALKSNITRTATDMATFVQQIFWYPSLIPNAT